MEVSTEYIKKYWEQIIADQIEQQYRAEGYAIEREVLLGSSTNSLRCDMIASKGDEHIVIEIISKDKRKEYLKFYYDFAKNHGYKFKCVYAPYPSINKKIDFDELESVLSNYFITEVPREIIEIGNHQEVDGVSCAEINEIMIDGCRMNVKGCCEINATIHLDHEEECSFDLSFPTQFQLNIEFDTEKRIWNITDDEDNVVVVDTEVFYGNGEDIIDKLL